MRNVYATVALNITRTDSTFEDLPDLFREWGLFTEAQEVIWIVSYDASTHLRSVVEVARGSQYEVTVDIATIMQAVWASGSSRFQLFHNHPMGGTIRPTKQDINLTRQVSVAAAVGELLLEDHVIIGPPAAWYSMRVHGDFQPSGKVVQLAAVRGPITLAHRR